MKQIKNFLWKYKHAIVILYFPLYMLWFIFLERRTDVDFTYIHCGIDDIIPFCEVFIIPYLLWFLYVAASLVFLFFQTKHLDEFYRCAAVLILGMTTSLLIYTFFPNAQDMRPTEFATENIFTDIISVLYATDTDTNVCPSIHVYNSIAIHIAISNCHYFKNKRWFRISSFTLCTLICLSTLFLKQHSFIDVVCGMVLYTFYYIIIYKPFAETKRLHAVD